jgi:hypothetical protein
MRFTLLRGVLVLVACTLPGSRAVFPRRKFNLKYDPARDGVPMVEMAESEGVASA